MQINTQPGIKPYKVSRKSQNNKSSSDSEFELAIGSSPKRGQKKQKEQKRNNQDADHHIDVQA